MQNSAISLVIPYNNKSAAAEAQNGGTFNKMRISSSLGQALHFAYFKEKKTQLHFKLRMRKNVTI